VTALTENENPEKLLKSRGYKLTGPRKMLLNILETNRGRCFTAQDLYEQLKETGIEFSTVYRNLELLADEGIVSVIRGNKDTRSYELCSGHHHHHLVCVNCGATRCIDSCPMSLITEHEWQGFTPIGHQFEIIGICPDCAKNSYTEKPG